MLIHTVSIVRPTPGKDAEGGITTTQTTTLHNSIPACLQPVSAQAEQLYSQWQIRVDHVLYTDRSLSGVTNGDYITHEGNTYIITGIRNILLDEQLYELLCYRYL